MRAIFGLIIGLMVCACGGTAELTNAPTIFPEAKVTVRNQVAAAVLSKRPRTVLLYARGLCCPSCGIGVRRAVSRLEFVDQQQPNRGVKLDPMHQLVEISIAEGQSVVSADLWQAITDAGYDPVTIYRKGAKGMETEDYQESPQ